MPVTTIALVADTVSALGAVTTPTAGQTIASIPAGSLPAGYYLIRIVGGASGTASPAPLINNAQLLRGASVFALLFNLPVFETLEGIWFMHLDGTQSVSVQAIANEATGILYNVGIRATRIA
jgi:hypothetical protein